jgi:hypothetical protein
VGEVRHRLVGIVHSNPDTALPFEVKDLSHNGLATCSRRREDQLQLSRSWQFNILAFVLIAVGVSADNQR